MKFCSHKSSTKYKHTCRYSAVPGHPSISNNFKQLDIRFFLPIVQGDVSTSNNSISSIHSTMDAGLVTATFWALADQTQALKTHLRPLVGSAANDLPPAGILVLVAAAVRALLPARFAVSQEGTPAVKVALVLLSLFAKRLAFQIAAGVLPLFPVFPHIAALNFVIMLLALVPFYALVVSLPVTRYQAIGSAVAVALISFPEPSDDNALLFFGVAAIAEIRHGKFKLTTPLLGTLAMAFCSLALVASPPHSDLWPIETFPLVHPTHNNIRILNSTQSTTGRIVVGELLPGKDSQYSTAIRYLRADHSLVGGKWLLPGGKLGESIYPAFYVQEAVRLINPQPKNKNAVLLGLGVGAAVDGLVAANYSTSIVELDPAVYDAAHMYFNLPKIDDVFIQDATVWVDNFKTGRSNKRYGIVIHDFFSGGGVPSQLFTKELFETLKTKVLSDDGILVVNFYASSSSIITQAIVRTVLEVFPTCTLLHDKLSPGAPDADEPLNQVLFCRKSFDYGLDFRATVQEDYGQTKLRKLVFQSLQSRQTKLNSIADLPAREYVITEKHNPLEKLQRSDSLHHWETMNQVLPQQAWELY